MAVDIVTDTASPVGFTPVDLQARPSSSTASFVSPGGTEKATPAVTVASIGAGGVASVSTATSQTEITVDDATGISAGDWLWLECDDGWRGSIRVSEIEGTAITLESRPPGTVDTAAKLYGLSFSLTIPLSATGTKDLHYRIDYTITDNDGATAHRRQMVNVVAMTFPDPVSDTDVARYAAANFPGIATSKDAGWYRGISERSSERIKQKLIAAGSYPHRIGDQSVFTSSGLIAMRIELAHEGLIIAGFDPESYINTQESRLGKQIREAIANTWIDRDDDNAVDPGDVRGYYSIRLLRQ